MDQADQMDQAPLKVLIADDHPLMLAGIRRVLERNSDIEVVGEACSGTELLPMVERRRPKVVLMDLQMPGASGVECIERITTTWPGVKTVVLSATEHKEAINAALDAGASAYVVKSVHANDIASVLRQVASGAVHHSTSRAQRHAQGGQCPDEPLLTEREREVLEGVAEGLITSAISQKLWVSEHTVKFHLTNIYRKLGVSNRAGAVRYALAHGIVSASLEGREAA